MRRSRFIGAGAVALCALALPAQAAVRPARTVPRPQTRITAGPPTRVTVAAGARVRFAFAASVQRARFECSLDGRRFRACRSPLVYRGLKAGRHGFAVRDNPGQRDYIVKVKSYLAQRIWATPDFASG